MTPEIIDRFWSHTKPLNNGCVVWTGGQTKGYGHFHVNRKDWYAHRFAYVISKGVIKPGEIVRHACDNPLCVNVDHLSVGTQKDNIKDMFERGRNPVKDHRGENHPNNKLTEKDVRTIRKSKESRSTLAKKYNVTYQTIRDIKLRMTWTHVT